MGESKCYPKASITEIRFPQGLYYNTNSEGYRTDRMNNLFNVISQVAMVSVNKQISTSKENPSNSLLVVPARIELASKV